MFTNCEKVIVLNRIIYKEGYQNNEFNLMS